MAESTNHFFLRPSELLSAKRIDFIDAINLVVYAELPLVTALRGKELIAGFWIWKCQSLQEAIEWVKRCPDPMPGEESTLEIRQIFEAADFGVEFTPELQAQEERLRTAIEQQNIA